MIPVKKNIKSNFDRSAKNYDENSQIQKNVSNHLLLMLEENKELIQSSENYFGLDLGCGTGDFSLGISKIFRLSKIHLIDIDIHEIHERDCNCKGCVDEIIAGVASMGPEDFE